MRRPPFKIVASSYSALTCDGRFVIAGRTSSFVWETFLMRRAAGVPGDYMMRGPRGALHSISATVEEAEAELLRWSPTFGRNRVRQARITRANRTRQGLEVG